MKKYEMEIKVTLDLDFLDDILSKALPHHEIDFNGDTCGISFSEFLLLKQIAKKVDMAECARIVQEFQLDDDRINKDKIYRKINDLMTI